MKHRYLRLSIAAASLVVIAGALTTAHFIKLAYASGGSTSEDGSLGGQCGDYWDTCYGAIWRKYNLYYSKDGSVTVSSDGNDIYVHDQGHAGGGHLYNCGRVGATEYYRLGLYVYKAGRYVAIGDQAGLIRVSQIYNLPGGSGTFNLVNFNALKSPEEWSDVQSKFESAKAATATSPAPITANWSDISMFCWNEEWVNNSSKFESYSQVNGANGYDVSDGDGTARLSDFTSEETYTATFTHSISYISGLTGASPTASIPTISTNYTVSNITISGGGSIQNVNYGTRNGTYTVSNPRTNENSGTFGSNQVTFTIPSGGTVEVCQTISYQPKIYKFRTQGAGYELVETSGNGRSTACITVSRQAVVEPTAGDGFWATGKVEVPSQNDVPGYTSPELSTKNGDRNATIKLSTDKDTLTAKFTFDMFYGAKLYDCGQYSSQTHSTACNNAIFGSDIAKYNLSSTVSNGSASGAQTRSSANFAVVQGSPRGSDSGGIMGRTFTVTISNIPAGSFTRFCQSLKHDRQSVTIQQSEHDHWINPCAPLGSCPRLVHDDYTYNVSSYSSAMSTPIELCVEVTRPVEPSGTGAFARNNATLMYAGENSEIGWDTLARPSMARRLSNFRAITYLVPARVPYSLNNVTGNLGQVYPNRANTDPCSWYSGARGGTSCNVINGRQQTWNPGTYILHRYDNVVQPISVPDTVGYKYCTSFGYQWEYWHSISYNGVDTWVHDAGKDYWTNYNAVCRTIAKKPSAAFWNGGVLSNGGLYTSLSSRSLSVGTAAQRVADYGLTHYGSWAEDLVSANGNVSQFASGASLSRGNASSDMQHSLSPLTISNNASPVGYSQLSTSNTLRTRLNSYLRNPPNAPAASSIASLQNLTSGTHIVHLPGGSTISNNITLNSGATYENIYQIPQVLIFVDGDLNIAPNVTRIDAWIIATGRINTCSSFSNGSTQTIAADNYANNNTCDKQLTFNGPVFANNLLLRRTYGADYIKQYARYAPAEVFNLTPATYLWAYAQAGRYKSSYTEAYSRELAPRY